MFLFVKFLRQNLFGIALKLRWLLKVIINSLKYFYGLNIVHLFRSALFLKVIIMLPGFYIAPPSSCGTYDVLVLCCFAQKALNEHHSDLLKIYVKPEPTKKNFMMSQSLRLCLLASSKLY